MPTNYYRHAIEALGMRSKVQTVVNKLNMVAAHSEDAELQKLAEKVIHELTFTSTDPTVTPVKEMNSVPTGKKLLSYCKQKYPEAD
jgi:hypothetical protein